MELWNGGSRTPIAIGGLTLVRILCMLCLVICPILGIAVWGCGGVSPTLELPTGSKGYVLYTFAKRTEIMIDFSRKDGISRGTKLDVYRMDVPGMDDPVKIGEVTVEEAGRKMSKAKVTAITSSLRMEPGDRIFPHPVTIATDDSWLTSRTPLDGWKSDTSLWDERGWEACEIIPPERVNIKPEVRGFMAETDAKPVWHPSIKSRHGDVFFRKSFVLDANPSLATLKVVCGGRTKMYLNDRWIGEAKEWPEISSFRVHHLLNEGRNLIAVQTTRDLQAKSPPVFFLAITVETRFQ